MYSQGGALSLTASRNKKLGHCLGVGGRGLVVLNWDITSRSLHWVTHGSLVFSPCCFRRRHLRSPPWSGLCLGRLSAGWTCQNKIRGMAHIRIYHRCHPLRRTPCLSKQQRISSSVQLACARANLTYWELVLFYCARAHASTYELKVTVMTKETAKNKGWKEIKHSVTAEPQAHQAAKISPRHDWEDQSLIFVPTPWRSIKAHLRAWDDQKCPALKNPAIDNF